VIHHQTHPIELLLNPEGRGVRNTRQRLMAAGQIAHHLTAIKAEQRDVVVLGQ
jgi:hypothetical protein